MNKEQNNICIERNNICIELLDLTNDWNFKNIDEFNHLNCDFDIDSKTKIELDSRCESFGKIENYKRPLIWLYLNTVKMGIKIDIINTFLKNSFQSNLLIFKYLYHFEQEEKEKEMKMEMEKQEYHNDNEDNIFIFSFSNHPLAISTSVEILSNPIFVTMLWISIITQYNIYLKKIRFLHKQCLDEYGNLLPFYFNGEDKIDNTPNIFETTQNNTIDNIDGDGDDGDDDDNVEPENFEDGEIENNDNHAFENENQDNSLNLNTISFESLVNQLSVENDYDIDNDSEYDSDNHHRLSDDDDNDDDADDVDEENEK